MDNQSKEADSHNDTNQSDSLEENPIDVMATDERGYVQKDINALNNPAASFNSENTQVNFNSSIMPASEMVILNKERSGAIDKIFEYGDREQAFSHSMYLKTHEEQKRINTANIEMTHKQAKLTNKKVNLTALLIVFMVICAVGLFAFDKVIGGCLMVALSAAVAIIFVLGQSPDGLFGIFRLKPPNSSEEE